MGCACSRPKALEPADPPQNGKADPAPPSVTPDAPAVAASPPEAAIVQKAAEPVREVSELSARASGPVEAQPAAAASAVAAPAASVAGASDTGPCDFPVLVVPRMQPRGARVHRSASADEGYGDGGQRSASSSVQHSRQNSADAAPSFVIAPTAVVMDDLVGRANTLHQR